VNVVRTVRRSAGLGVMQCAARAGIAHARVSEYEKGSHDPSLGRMQDLARVAGLRLVAVPVPSATASAAEAADEIYELLRGGAPWQRALRVAFQLHDDLTAAPPYVLGALVAAPAPSTDDARFDALIAGLVEWHVEQHRLPVPPWVMEPGRTVTPCWQPDPHTDPADAVETLARHGVILARSELVSV